MADRTDNVRSALFYQKHARLASDKARHLVSLLASLSGREDAQAQLYWKARAAQYDARRMADLASHFLALTVR